MDKSSVRLLYFVAFVVIALLSGCAGEPYAPPILPTASPTATPNPGEIALQMLQEQMAAEATSQVVALQLEATQQVINATATESQRLVYVGQTQQARRDADATAQQERENIAATQSRMDADAATQQARDDLMATQSAYATSTFVVMTLSAVPTSAALTAVANEQRIALKNDEVTQSKMDTNQKPYEWAIRLLLVLAAMIVGAVVGLRWSRTREVKDEDGRVRVLVFDNKHVVAPSLLPAPVLDLETMTSPTLSAEQGEVTKRAQMVEMVAAMPAASPATSDNLIGMFQTKPPRFEISSPPAEMLDVETVKSIEADWKAENE